jgi:Mrp family chromosome partitioning ATPase
MSNIYQALRRHELVSGNGAPAVQGQSSAHGTMERALEPVYPLIRRLTKEAGHGLIVHFVAPTEGEGTSTLSTQFARLAARSADSKVLLIDGNWSKPSTASEFGCSTDSGLLEKMQFGDDALDHALVSAPESPQLHVGVICGNNTKPFHRKAVPDLYMRLRSMYDLTILDCPAVFSDHYFQLAPEAADAIVMVVRAEHARPEIIRQAKSLIDDSGGKLVGAILNQRRNYIPNFIYRLL